MYHRVTTLKGMIKGLHITKLPALEILQKKQKKNMEVCIHRKGLLTYRSLILMTPKRDKKNAL